jgi:type II secretory ATPase GspE/PulE/Tfp pilus assembly ATPase PilB-like protein/putative methionine-R-sulfoxide reductase with GAF domain
MEPVVSESTAVRSLDDDLRVRIKVLHDLVQNATVFSSIYGEIEPQILNLLGAERMTIYQRQKKGDVIVSRFKTGSDVKEIRVPLSTNSIAGFVALTQQPLFINDVYDEAGLRNLHSNLRFDRSFDQKTGFRTRSMIVVPIMSGKALLGVLQIINKRGGDAFSDMDGKIAIHIAKIIASKFQQDVHATAAPYALLLQLGLISADKLEDLLERASKRRVHPSRLLMEEIHIPAEQIGKSLETYYQVPYQPYDPAIQLPQVLMTEVKPAYLRKLLCIPIQGDRHQVTIAIDDPSDHTRILEIQRVLRAESIALRVSLPVDILRFLGETASPGSADLGAIMDQLEGEAALITEGAEEADNGGLDENAAPIIQLVNKIIADAVVIGASDIHVEPGKERTPTRVRMRVDGLCRETLQIPATYAPAVLSRIKIMSRLDIAERRKPQDGKCKLKLGNRSIELRVATIPTVNGESAVMRVLSNAGALPLEKLNLTQRNFDAIQELVAHPHGIFLVVGPTGSGKTTTLHAVLGYLNTADRKIWTAEDPVEITQPGLQQVQVLPKIGFDFAAAMRAFLRADPDIILIGEMRDRETSHIGIEASLTGHLVLSTLHTNSAPETVTRLLDLGVDPMNFADALLGVLAQRLMRTLCGECKQPYQPNPHEIQQLMHAYGEAQFAELGADPATLKLHKAVGCKKCGDTGYRGRTGIHELLKSSLAMRELIFNKASVADVRELAIKEGMRTLIQDGVGKILQGQSDLIQLFRVASG